MVTLVQLGTAAASAADGTEEIRSSCWATGNMSEDVVAIAREAERWSCAGREYAIDAERVLLRFDISPDDTLPRYLLSRRSALDAVHLLAIDGNGAVAQTSVPAASLRSSMAGGYFKASLPEVTQATRQIIAVFDLPSHRMTLEQAYLASADASGGIADTRFLIFLSALAGMLVMPLIFNAAFYRVLREPFVLWHSALTLSLLTTILLSSGLSVLLFDAPAMTLSWMTTLTFGITTASGAMFAYSFIEPGLMHPRLRRLLPYCAAWAIFLSGFHAAFPFLARPIQSTAYTAAFAPVLIVFTWSLIDAVGRGSRAGRFQAVGYVPLVAVGAIRLVTGVIPLFDSNDAMLLFYVGCLWEMVFTTLGVADRFLTLKRERDWARNEAELLERISETDPLTGLSNRRAVERQFEQLRGEGFHTLAVIDLDHFKEINDLKGHSAGDAVLRAVATALRPCPNVRVYRLGGEEFMLFLRGDDSAAQAERRRQSISAIVAETVPCLEWQVTASMGVTDVSGDEGFDKPYDRADKLLYEAKRAGRNRTRSGIRAMPALDMPAGERVVTA